MFTTSKEPRPPERERRGINKLGVDFWHAVEFSRNGRFLRTHPRNSLRLSSGQFPFGLTVLRLRLYQTVSRPDFLGAFQVSAFTFPFPATPTLPDPFGPDSQPDRACLHGCWAVPTSQTLADPLGDSQSGRQLHRTSWSPIRIEFGHAEITPTGRSC